MFIEQPPEFVRKLYPGAIWRMDPNEKAVYLTFDDGPIPEVTPWYLIYWTNTTSKPPSLWWETIYASILMYIKW